MVNELGQQHRPPVPRQADPRGEPPARSTGWRSWLPTVALMLLGLTLLLTLRTSTPAATPYSDFLAKADAGKVSSVTIAADGTLHAVLKAGGDVTSVVPTAVGDPTLLARLAKDGVTVTAVTAASGASGVWQVVAGLLPLLVFVALIVWSLRAMRRQLAAAGSGFGIGRSRARLVDPERPEAGFADVAGYDGVKQEIVEVVDYLKQPDRYRRAGAKGPRGVLMVGPPGTGKTLLAKAVAAEAGVPFYSVTGSSFVEMFVGVGAARVRDLFREVRANAPAILFVDEIDAIGQRRSGAGMIGNDEREQTVNELLAAMDGFDTSRDAPVVVLGATNRPQALDVALLRPGRFDRQVLVPLPTLEDRAAILAVHARGIRMTPDVDLTVVARRTPGFSGADLANLVNEAALYAVRHDRTVVTGADLDAAQDRIQLGRRDDSHHLLPEERHAVAVRESGHALVAALCPRADPVSRVTILPTGFSLGATHQLPEDERHLFSEAHLRDRLTVALAGRAAERVALDTLSTGAANDLQAATTLATRMVREYGMSPAVGPVAYGEPDSLALPGGDLPVGRTYAEATQRVVDEEVARLLREAEDRATTLLEAHRQALDRLVVRLELEETVTGDAVLEALAPERRRAPSGPSGAGSTDVRA